MKTFKLSLLLLLCVSFGFNSCDKDEDETKPLSETYFQIEDADFLNSEFPASSTSVDAPSISSIYGNSNILAGGSNPLTINTSSSISHVLVGVNEEKGYFKIPVSSNKSTNSIYIVYLIFSQELEFDDFSIVVAVINDNGLVSSHEYINVSKIEAGTGKLQISCSWDKPNDVDLHLVEPNEEEIYFGNSYSDNGGDLDVDSNPDCVLDNINNENITYSETATVESGEYIVRVDLYSNCSVAGNTNYVVTAHYNGQAISPKYGQNPYYGSFTSEDADYGSEGSGYTVMKFDIGSSKNTSDMVFSEGIRFEYPHNNTDKPKNLSPFKSVSL